MKIEDFIGLENKFILIINEYIDIRYVIRIDEVCVDSDGVIVKAFWNDFYGVSTGTCCVKFPGYEYCSWLLLGIFDEFPKELLI